MEHSCAHGLLVNSSDTGDLKVGQKVDLSVKSSAHRVYTSTCNRMTESDHVSLRNRHLWILRFRFEWGGGESLNWGTGSEADSQQNSVQLSIGSVLRVCEKELG